MKTMRKIITVILSAILTLSCGLFLFACEEKKEKDFGIYLEVTLDSRVEGIESQTFYMNDENRLKKFEFECFPSTEEYFYFSARAFREGTNELLSTLEYTKSFEDRSSWAKFNYAGVYTYCQSYEKYGDFVIEVTMVDHRPKITAEFLSFEPHTVEAYENGMLFTYDYDGQMHFPHLRYFVDNKFYTYISEFEQITSEASDIFRKYEDGEWLWWAEDEFMAGEKGLYRFTFSHRGTSLFRDTWEEYQPFEYVVYIKIQ